MIVIEINLLLDRLEALLVESRPFMLTSNVLVDRDRCFDIINQMRVSIPEEVKKSKRVYQERDRIIAQANEEASRIVQMAREQATDLVENHELVDQARQRASEIIVEAEQEMSTMRAEADQYAVNSLTHLAEEVARLQREVDNGIKALQGQLTS